MTGIAALQVSDEAAARYAEKFLGCDLLTAPATVSDTIGEICFLIAQAAKGQLEAFNLELAMPVVVRSRETQLDLPRQAMVVGIPFESELGPICCQSACATNLDAINRLKSYYPPRRWTSGWLSRLKSLPIMPEMPLGFSRSSTEPTGGY